MKIDELGLHVWRGKASRSARPVIPTGFPSLDSHLPGGGWPRGALTEVYVDRYGVGELTLLAPALARLTRSDPAEEEKKWVVWVAPPFIPYAPALKQRGVNLDCVLLVHPTGMKNGHWAVEQVVRSGASSGVLAWLAAADGIVLRRLQLAAEQRCCWTVLFRPAAARRSRSPAALRIGLSRDGTTTRVQIIKCRGARPAVVVLPDEEMSRRVSSCSTTTSAVFPGNAVNPSMEAPAAPSMAPTVPGNTAEVVVEQELTRRRFNESGERD
jgi:hypothetical protein